MSILSETLELLKTKYQNRFENLYISDVRIGIFLTAVILSDGSCGVAGTITDPNTNCSKGERDFDDYTPSHIKGKNVVDLLATSKSLRILDTLKLAVLNAISSKFISDSDYKIIENADPIDYIDLSGSKTITLVGAFQSYIRKIEATKNRLYVLELDEDALNSDQKQFYVPASDYRRILSISDIVIITGLTLANNTIDELLAEIPANSEIIVTGPSCNLIPDVMFGKNVKIIGATHFTDPSMVLDIVSEAGTGFHLFRYCATKICVINEK